MPIPRCSQSGKKLAKFSLATNESYRNQQGEKIEETQWHNIVAWGKKAELAENYLKKVSIADVISSTISSGPYPGQTCGFDAQPIQFIFSRTAHLLFRK